VQVKNINVVGLYTSTAVCCTSTAGCPMFFITDLARRILNVTHQGAACDAAIVDFGPTIKKTVILFMLILLA